MAREVRINATSLKRAAGEGRSIEGYCSVFDSPADIDSMFGGFTEIVKKGAFSRCLSEGADIRCLWSHDPSQILGRTKSGTATYREDSHGLFFKCDMPDTTLGRDLLTSIERGDVSGASIGFQVLKQDWLDEKQADGTTKTTRTILDMELYDGGPVTYPAVVATSVDARSQLYFPEGLPQEVRSHVRSSVVPPAAIARMRSRMKVLQGEIGHRAADSEECDCNCSNCALAHDCASCNCTGDCSGENCGNQECACATHADERSLQRKFGVGPFAGDGPRTIVPVGTQPWERQAAREEAERLWALRQKMREASRRF